MELLVVIAVIAIIAAIAIPNIANITDSADTAKAQRNAQNIASVASAARAAGHPAFTTRADAITQVTEGITIVGGAFNGQTFAVPGLSETEITAATEFLAEDLVGGNLIYVKEVAAAGGAEDPVVPPAD